MEFVSLSTQHPEKLFNRLLKNAIPPNQIHADMQEKAIKKQINRGSLQKFELLEIRLRSIGAWMSYLSLDDNLKQNGRMKNAKKSGRYHVAWLSFSFSQSFILSCWIFCFNYHIPFHFPELRIDSLSKASS